MIFRIMAVWGIGILRMYCRGGGGGMGVYRDMYIW